MTRQETINNLKAYLNGDTAIGDIIPLRSVLESALEYLKPSLPSNLDEAAEEYFKQYNYMPKGFVVDAFKAGAEWMAGQFVLVEGEPTGWFRTNDGSEYATGLDLKEPIKLPVDFYVRKK